MEGAAKAEVATGVEEMVEAATVEVERAVVERAEAL